MINQWASYKKKSIAQIWDGEILRTESNSMSKLLKLQILNEHYSIRVFAVLLINTKERLKSRILQHLMGKGYCVHLILYFKAHLRTDRKSMAIYKNILLNNIQDLSKMAFHMVRMVSKECQASFESMLVNFRMVIEMA